MTRLRSVPGLLAASLLLSSLASAQDDVGWPQWRGPHDDGISRETGWVIEGAEEPLWEASLGLGYSAVSVQNGRLFTMGHDAEFQEDMVFCLDPLTGEENWVLPFPSQTWKRAHTGGTLTTPSVDGDVVFVSNREGRFFRLAADTGEIHWEKQLKEEYDLKYPRWMFGASPYVLEDQVVMNVGVVLAFDKDGELLWKTERNYGDAYANPVAFEHEGRACLAIFDSEGVAVLDLEKGTELAFQKWTTANLVHAATPIVTGNRVFISSGMTTGCGMFAFTGSSLDLEWQSLVMRNAMAGCMLWEDHLYGIDERVLKCVDLDGEELWADSSIGLGCCAMADGKLIALSARGELVIAEASTTAYQELYRKKVLDGGKYWTVPVLMGGLIYCRNSDGDFVCLDHRAKGE